MVFIRDFGSFGFRNKYLFFGNPDWDKDCDASNISTCDFTNRKKSRKTESKNSRPRNASNFKQPTELGALRGFAKQGVISVACRHAASIVFVEQDDKLSDFSKSQSELIGGVVAGSALNLLQIETFLQSRAEKVIFAREYLAYVFVSLQFPIVTQIMFVLV